MLDSKGCGEMQFNKSAYGQEEAGRNRSVNPGIF